MLTLPAVRVAAPAAARRSDRRRAARDSRGGRHNRRDEAVAAAMRGLDVARLLRVVAQRLAQPRGRCSSAPRRRRTRRPHRRRSAPLCVTSRPACDTRWCSSANAFGVSGTASSRRDTGARSRHRAGTRRRSRRGRPSDELVALTFSIPAARSYRILTELSPPPDVFRGARLVSSCRRSCSMQDAAPIRSHRSFWLRRRSPRTGIGPDARRPRHSTSTTRHPPATTPPPAPGSRSRRGCRTSACTRSR